jgi:cation transport regulator ChaC
VGNHANPGTGILAYGSLIVDPGEEIDASKIGIIENAETPFAVEFARQSGAKRGGAPTLVPVATGGAKVIGKIILLKASIDDAVDMLYRREIQAVGSGKRYTIPPESVTGRVRVKQLRDFYGVPTVLYTDLDKNIESPSAAKLAEFAIQSVSIADAGKDGISYLIGAKRSGIRTALSEEYTEAILEKTGTRTLEDALRKLLAEKD